MGGFPFICLQISHSEHHVRQMVGLNSPAGSVPQHAPLFGRSCISIWERSFCVACGRIGLSSTAKLMPCENAVSKKWVFWELRAGGRCPGLKREAGAELCVGKLVHPTPAPRSSEDSQGCRLSIVTWQTVRFKIHIRLNAASIYLARLRFQHLFLSEKGKKKTSRENK